MWYLLILNPYCDEIEGSPSWFFFVFARSIDPTSSQYRELTSDYSSKLVLVLVVPASIVAGDATLIRNRVREPREYGTERKHIPRMYRAVALKGLELTPVSAAFSKFSDLFFATPFYPLGIILESN